MDELKKGSGLNAEDKDRLHNQLEEVGKGIEGIVKFDGFGMCGVCSKFMYASSGDKIIAAACRSFEMKLSLAHQITECTSYADKYALSLWTMMDMAYFIDGKDRKIGFGK